MICMVGDHPNKEIDDTTGDGQEGEELAPHRAENGIIGTIIAKDGDPSYIYIPYHTYIPYIHIYIYHIWYGIHTPPHQKTKYS